MEKKRLIELLKERVLILDGAMGTMIQNLGLTDADFRGSRFASHPVKLEGCNDILVLTCPDAVRRIHSAYLSAGADIISTDTFNANSISLADYGLSSAAVVAEINEAAARIAREAAEAAPARKWGGRALVAGSIGPTNRTASMSPDVADTAKRDVDYDMLYLAYSRQVEGLLDGGVDILLFETVFDTLNLKAGLDAAGAVMEKRGSDIPVMVSATVADKSGRTLSGQTIKAFITSVENYPHVVSIGLNCSFGPSQIIPYLKELSDNTSHFVSCHPNAGLPNALGGYDETPGLFVEHVGAMLSKGLLNIAGGCCGTTPDHIRLLARKAEEYAPRVPALLTPALRLSGLEELTVLPENNFVNVGERCNVAGSRKFLRLIRERNYTEAMAVAAKQVADGAMLIDVNMDDSLLDVKEEMVTFLRYAASDPDIARVPVMVDSSEWEVIENALKNLQGKGVVNSISLKEGEEAFLFKGRRIKELGAAVIVMAFDENGQADTFKRKIEVSERAYRLLVDKCGFNPQDIIFDVNIMAVATGMEEHRLYGIDFIKAVAWIKENLPGARTSGGVSNLSFAFRGKNALREAMHAVFLYHAIKAGLDMAIMNPSSSVTYEDIDPKLRGLIEDVVLARRYGAEEELAAYAMSENASAKKEAAEEVRDLSVATSERLKMAIISGKGRFLADDLEEALKDGMTPVGIIEGPLMEGMRHVGDLFGEGKMFLPQVVKTARTMKQAVDFLRPYMENSGRSGVKAGKVVFATVKGDVHDIGKNIVSIVLACNNFEVIDLGVMVPAEVIVETVLRERPDFVCLSGLITPSLSEMVAVAKALEESGIDIPLMVGGATTSRLHTALKIAPAYHGPVVHAADASQNPIIASRFLDGSGREFAESLRREYEEMRAEYEGRERGRLRLPEARDRKRKQKERIAFKPVSPLGIPVDLYPGAADLLPLINWKMFFHAWRISGSFLSAFPYDLCDGCIAAWRASLKEDEKIKGEEALKLYRDAVEALREYSESGWLDVKGSVVFHECRSEEDDIVVGNERIPMLRQQGDSTETLSLSDFVLPEKYGPDYIGVFCVTAGQTITSDSERYRNEGDEYRSLLLQTLSDRLAEAASEWMHAEVRTRLWGYSPDEDGTPASRLCGEYIGIRPAVGYPSMPDQLLNQTLDRLLHFGRLGVKLTENGAMWPTSSISGLYIADPESRHFMVGEIGEDQLADYSRRRGMDEDRMKEILKI